MSVVISGAFVAQTVALALMGLVLLAMVGVWCIGYSGRSSRGVTHLRTRLPARWLEVSARLLSVIGTPLAPRAPPAGCAGSVQPIPVSTNAYRRRFVRRNDLP